MKHVPVVAGLAGCLVLAPLVAPSTATITQPAARVSPDRRTPVAFGSGGAVATVDPDATRAGLDVLRAGGNAVDAAVATAAALGVTEPYSAGIGGGGFLVYYDAKTRRGQTIDGRETAPATFTEKTFTNPDGTAYNFATTVSSGLSVGVPGTPALWDKAARRFGTK